MHAIEAVGFQLCGHVNAVSRESFEMEAAFVYEIHMRMGIINRYKEAKLYPVISYYPVISSMNMGDGCGEEEEWRIREGWATQ